MSRAYFKGVVWAISLATSFACLAAPQESKFSKTLHFSDVYAMNYQGERFAEYDMTCQQHYGNYFSKPMKVSYATYSSGGSGGEEGQAQLFDVVIALQPLGLSGEQAFMSSDVESKIPDALRVGFSQKGQDVSGYVILKGDGKTYVCKAYANSAYP